MSDPAIRVQNLGKKYRLRHQSEGRRYKTLRDVLTEAPRRWWKGFSAPSQPADRTASVEDFWALKDVSFEIPQGGAVGIIGRNGAGKSTLLKLLSRITEPTTGRIEIEGRVSSLLEVGTGFHPELTGRENIYLNGAILGMSRAEISRRFDEIVAFAEVEKFLDTPVKRYSSGMYMRLAFAVAAHLEPEILIVDEVLAVGDAAFQKKCLGRMSQVSTQGRTVLFVSHNMGAVSALCGHAICMERGQIVQQGAAREVIASYLTRNTDAQEQSMDVLQFQRGPGHGDKLKIAKVNWLTPLPLQHGETACVQIHFTAVQDVEDITMGIGFSTLEGTRLLTYETDFQDGHRPSLKAGSKHTARCTIPELPLAPGMYSVDFGSRSGDSFTLDYLPGVMQLEIAMGKTTPGHIDRQGAGVRLLSDWRWEET
jgi:lipopolysaccharide transport system ATP-binding protein